MARLLSSRSPSSHHLQHAAQPGARSGWTAAAAAAAATGQAAPAAGVPRNRTAALWAGLLVACGLAFGYGWVRELDGLGEQSEPATGGPYPSAKSATDMAPTCLRNHHRPRAPGVCSSAEQKNISNLPPPACTTLVPVQVQLAGICGPQSGLQHARGSREAAAQPLAAAAQAAAGAGCR